MKAYVFGCSGGSTGLITTTLYLNYVVVTWDGTNASTGGSVAVDASYSDTRATLRTKLLAAILAAYGVVSADVVFVNE